MRPSETLVAQYSQRHGRRALATLEEDQGDYLIISLANVPRQFADEEDKETVEVAAKSSVTILASSFALSFLLSLFLSGAMASMWVLQSLLQLIITLPMMQVLMPANVLHFEQYVRGIINFQLVDPEVVMRLLRLPACTEMSGGERCVGSIVPQII